MYTISRRVIRRAIRKVLCVGGIVIILFLSLSAFQVPAIIQAPIELVATLEEQSTMLGEIEREPINLELPKETTLYSLTDVSKWDTKFKQYQERTDLTTQERESVNELRTMCATIISITTDQLNTGETAPQVLAKIVTQEIGGLSEQDSYSTRNMERAAVVWCILNRIDSYGTPDAEGIAAIAKSPNQFAYYKNKTIFEGIEELCVDVLIRWQLEKTLEAQSIGRVLPAQYVYFTGDGKHNRFRSTFKKSSYWDWSLDDPYIK